jgi:hypothetical protein
MKISQQIALLLSGTMALGSPVSSEYKSPNRFTGKIDLVTVELK